MTEGSGAPVRPPDRVRRVATAMGCAAFAMNLYRLGAKPLWRDEALTVVDVDRPLASMLRLIWNREANMGLYFLLQHVWTRLAGSSSELLLRLPSATAGAVAVAGVYVLGSRLYRPRVGLIAAVLVAVHPALFLQAQFARAYPFVIAGVVWSGLALLGFVDRRSVRSALVYGLSVGALGWFQALAVLALPAHLVLLWPLGRHRRLVAVAAGVAAPFFAVLLAAIVNQQDGDNIGWIAELSWEQARAALDVLVVGRWGLVLLAAVFFLAASRSSSLRMDRRLAFLVAWALVPPLGLAAISTVQPAFIDRYLLVAVPGALLAVGAAVGSVVAPLRSVALALTGGLLGLFAHASWIQARASFWLEDLRAAAVYVEQRAEPGDAVVYSPFVSRVGIGYYLAEQEVELRDLAAVGTAVEADDWVPRQRPTAEICADLASTERVWVMSYGSGTGSVTAAPDAWSPFPEGGAACIRDQFDSFEVEATEHFGLRASLLERRDR